MVFYVRICTTTMKKWIVEVADMRYDMCYYGCNECRMMIPGTYKEMMKDYG